MHGTCKAGDQRQRLNVARAMAGWPPSRQLSRRPLVKSREQRRLEESQARSVPDHAPFGDQTTGRDLASLSLSWGASIAGERTEISSDRASGDSTAANMPAWTLDPHNLGLLGSAVWLGNFLGSRYLYDDGSACSMMWRWREVR